MRRLVLCLLLTGSSLFAADEAPRSVDPRVTIELFAEDLRSLLDVLKDEEYDRLYSLAASGITSIQQQSEEGVEGPIETCLTAVYGVMVLRAQGRQVSEATLEAVESRLPAEKLDAYLR
jgi:hypothetical protein